MEQANILLVDDDVEILESLARTLGASALNVSIYTATNSAKALALFEQHSISVAVIDLCLDTNLGVESGFALLRDILELDANCRVIVLTGHGSIEYGVRSLNEGAASFLEKPADISHLIALINDGVKLSALKREYSAIKQAVSVDELASCIIGQSIKMQELREALSYAAQTKLPVLLTGETGTGKGLCASAIHRFGPRSPNPFVRYQPNYASSDMLSSDLFGHVKGAFTGANTDRRGLIAEAHLGTLFLDEIDELPLKTQVTLLGVLQDKQFRPVGTNKEEVIDFRLVCASNQDIETCLEEGKLRSDFYHRIAHSVIHIPALRERKEDIAVLSYHILKRIKEREGVSVIGIEEAAIAALVNYDWPGNVRELEAVIESAAYKVQFDGRARIAKDDLRINLNSSSAATLDYHELVYAYKHKLISEALSRNGGNQKKAAQEINLDRSTMRRFLAKSKGVR